MHNNVYILHLEVELSVQYNIGCHVTIEMKNNSYISLKKQKYSSSKVVSYLNAISSSKLGNVICKWKQAVFVNRSEPCGAGGGGGGAGGARGDSPLR